MRGPNVAILLVVAVRCASSSVDYTPQITVVPGAAARSLWIQSKSPESGPESGEDAKAPDEPHPNTAPNVAADEGDATSE
jgi:hypothetical protein